MNLRKLLATTAAVAATMAFGSPTLAQTTPAFRVPLGKSSSTSTASAIWMWQQQVSSCSNTCGTGTRTTSYVCQNAADYDYSGAGYGVPEADAQCVSAVGAKPASASQACTVYSSCSYDWVKPPVVFTPMAVGSNPLGRSGCGYGRAQFDPYCKRSDGTVMSKGDYAFCKADLPDYSDVAANKPDALGYDRVETQTGSCNTTDHEWITGAYSAWSNTCSATATHTRTVSCRRKFDGSSAVDGMCDPSTRPVASETQAVYSGCTYSWQNGSWGASSNTCSSSATQTRAVWCRRDQTTETVGDTFCNASTRPASSQQVADYSTCTYSVGAWSAWSYASACSSNTTRTASATSCIRSDGTSVPITECSSRGIAVTKSETGQTNYASCTYSWQNGAWSASSSTCSSAATQTRAVWCRRDQTGETVGDPSCNASTRPASSQQVQDYSTCSYAVGSWSGWTYASTCSSNTSRTASATSCIRSDGTAVALTECSSRGVAMTMTQGGQANYSSCTYSWQTGGWSGSSNTCSSNATQTRAVWCRRDQTGETVGDTACNAGTRPASSQQVQDYSTCSYSWGPATYTSDWDSHCSANAYRYIDHSCIRSDGATVSTTYCDQAGIGHRENQNAAIYDGCSYYGGPWWGDWSWDTTCSSQAHRTQHRTCMRSDGTPMPSGSYCTDRGVPVSDTVTEANYSGCSYSVGPGWGWSDWNSHCSGNAYREQGHSCIRSDGYVDNNYADNECSRRGMTTWDRQWAGVYDGCGYNAVNWSGWSACSNSSQSQSAQCQRSDGAIVANSECNNRGVQTYRTQSCQSSCTSFQGSQGWYYCTGNARQWQPGDQVGQNGVRCIGAMDMQPTGNTQSDSTVSYIFTTDGPAAPVPGWAQTWTTTNLQFNPYGAAWQGGGVEQHADYYTLSSCY